DLFSGRGIARNLRALGNEACLAALADVIDEEPDPEGSLVFANLVDFDTLYGHRNDPAGYAEALRAFDAGLGRLLEALRPGDVLMVTADHGNDPTTPSTDHSRELVPILAVGHRVPAGLDLGRRQPRKLRLLRPRLSSRSSRNRWRCWPRTWWSRCSRWSLRRHLRWTCPSAGSSLSSIRRAASARPRRRSTWARPSPPRAPGSSWST